MPRPTITWRGPLALLLALFTQLYVSCLGPGGSESIPVVGNASRALARARQARRLGTPPDDPQLLASLEVARRAADSWVAPRRLEDDLALEGYREVEALERRRDELSEAPRDPRAIYLLARLEGRVDGRDFARAVGLDPTFAWGWHGLAWTHARRGETGEARRAEARAVALARDPWERAFFTLALARQLEDARLPDEGLELLRRGLEEIPLANGDRTWLALEVTFYELRQWNLREREVGHARALELIRSGTLPDRDLLRLVTVLRNEVILNDPGGFELELALSSLPGELPARLLAEGWVRRGSGPLGRLLWQAELERAGGGPVAAQLERRSAFRQGFHAEAVRVWLDDLPGQVLAEDFLPADERLRRLVLAAREVEASGSADRAALKSFGETLIEAGWFFEAQQVADALAPLDLAAALSLRERAVAGRVLFTGVGAVLGDVEEGRAEIAGAVAISVAGEDQTGGRDPAKETGAEGGPGDLDELLRRWGPLFARCAERLGRGAAGGDVEATTAALLASPRLRYGFLATVLHPGPRFSAADEAAGLGPRGEAVGGLAAELERYGRFAIFGQVLGGGLPDGTILRRLLVEERSGEHFGVPWRGTVAWCDGTDLLSRPARQGARISGAALHEGYWLDVASVRLDRDRWDRLAAAFEGPAGEARLERALASPALRLRTPPSHPRSRRRERLALSPVLGEARRVRLAAMRSRRAPGELLGRVSLDELVEAVAVHEEGHLCDRTRFLPIDENLGAILAFLIDRGFSPAGVQRHLEYRAQLTALCELPDPRLPLAEILDAVDGGGSLGGLPHGEAYTELVRDLLALLDRELDRYPDRWPTLDPDRTLLHQLHRLEPDEIRRLALMLARREGLL